MTNHGWPNPDDLWYAHPLRDRAGLEALREWVLGQRDGALEWTKRTGEGESLRFAIHMTDVAMVLFEIIRMLPPIPEPLPGYAEPIPAGVLTSPTAPLPPVSGLHARPRPRPYPRPIISGQRVQL